MSKYTDTADPVAPIPDARQVVAQVLTEKGYPTGQDEVDRALGLFEPCGPRERRFTKSLPTGRMVDIDPYATRVGQLLRAYIRLDADFQQLIRDARHDGIWWRGDDYEFFMRVCAETLKYRENPETYVAQTRAALNLALR